MVFPELSLTGYELNAPALAPSDSRLGSITDACRETGSVAFAGAPVHGETGHDHIATLAFDAAGPTVAYRKMWLGGAESERFTPGDAPVIFEIDGWRLALAICKDTGVPQHAAEAATAGFDVYLAGVLESINDAGVIPARARRVANDHGVWVVIASFAGSTGGGYESAAGRSGIWRPDGSVATEAGPEVGAIAQATISD